MSQARSDTNLLAHPVQRLLLERKESTREVSRLLGLDRLDDGNVGFKIAPGVAQFRMENAKRSSRLFRLK